MYLATHGASCICCDSEHQLQLQCSPYMHIWNFAWVEYSKLNVRTRVGIECECHSACHQICTYMKLMKLNCSFIVLFVLNFKWYYAPCFPICLSPLFDTCILSYILRVGKDGPLCRAFKHSMGDQWGARVDKGQLWAHQDVQSRGEREFLCLGCGLSIQDSEGCNFNGLLGGLYLYT